MDFTGFNKAYPAKRPLTDQERERRLLQKMRLDVKEGDDLSVIRFNSTYMEVVDKWFAWRGIPATVGIAFTCILGWLPLYWAYDLIVHPEKIAEEWPWFLLILAIGAPFFLFFGWIVKKDGFRFTHYPIRLNRKTQMVHVFRTDGTVLSAPWKDLFFCITSLPQNNWEIQGHVLSTDGVTVKETFALPATGTGAADRDQLPRYWEFVRRYMEEGPGSVSARVEYCLPIANQRERFTDGFHRMHGQAHALFAPILIAVLLFLYILPYPGRWLAMRTSQLPVWPKEVDDVCVVEANDLYRKDASMNKPITDHSLIFLVAAIGIGLLVWAWWD